MIASIADRLLGLHGWPAAAVVFALPALECSAFVGFVFPGEIAVLLGGVLAYQHKVSLPVVLVAAIAGAIIGDSVGYEIGKRWGRRLLHGTVGRIVKAHHLDRAEKYLADNGGKAVFFGRFTAALRVLVPGLAGMAGMPYRTFLFCNAAGGALWAGGFTAAGYAAGSGWRDVEHIAGRASLVLLLLAVIAATIVFTARWISRNHDRVRGFVDRRLDTPVLARLRARYRRQLDFLQRRLRPGEALGLSLTVSLAVLIGVGWVFGAVAQDVIAGDEAARLDRPVLEWFIRHREPWLTAAAKLVTPLGSSAVLVPIGVLIAIWWWHRFGSTRSFVLVGAGYLGAEALFRTVKAVTGRARPAIPLAVQHVSGSAFPSGHATLATVVWGCVAALISTAATSWPAKVAVCTAAVALTVLIGLTRLYLGAHWLTDVLGGWALGGMWLIVVLTAAHPGRAAPGRLTAQRTPAPSADNEHTE